MSTIYQYIIDITAKNQQFLQAMQQSAGKINDVDKRVNQAQRSVDNMYGGLKRMGGALGIAFSIGTVTSFLTESDKAYREAIAAETKVQQAIRSTGSAAGLTLDQLKKKAADLQDGTIFDGDTVLNDVTAQLLTFTNIAGKNFLRTQQAALNLSTVLEGDLKGASIQLGKALNDPVQGLSALSRSGIQFSDEQKNLIKSLVETNQLAKAQTIILDELDRQYSGQAEAVAKAMGNVNQLTNAWGDLKEEIGGAIANSKAFLDIVNTMGRAISGQESGTERGQGFVNSFLESLPEDAEKARKELDEQLSEYRTSLADFQNTLTKELANPSIKDLFFRKEHQQRIDNLKREVEAYKFALDTLPSSFETWVKATENVDNKNQQQVTTIGTLEGQIKDLNEQLKTTNIYDTASLGIIAQKIQALEKLKKAIESQATDPASFRTDKFEAIEPRTQNVQVSMQKPSKGFDAESLSGTFDVSPQLNIDEMMKNMPVYEGYVESMIEYQDRLQEKNAAVQDAFQQGFGAIGQSIVEGLGLASDGFEGFIGGLLNTTITLISMMLAQSMANSIAGATAAGAATGPASIITTPAFIATAIAGVLGAFAALPSFETGGIVPGQSWTGDKTLIRVNSGEEILRRNDPRHALNQQSGTIGGSEQTVTQVFFSQKGLEVNGSTIRFILQKEERKVKLRTGK